MQYVYLLKLKSLSETEERKIVVVSGSKWEEIDIKTEGSTTSILSKNNCKNKILYKERIELFDLIYKSIVKEFKNYSIGGLHISKGGYYLTIDNSTWHIYNKIDVKDDEYKEIFLRV